MALKQLTETNRTSIHICVEDFMKNKMAEGRWRAPSAIALPSLKYMKKVYLLTSKLEEASSSGFYFPCICPR